MRLMLLQVCLMVTHLTPCHEQSFFAIQKEHKFLLQQPEDMHSHQSEHLFTDTVVCVRSVYIFICQIEPQLKNVSVKESETTILNHH